MPDRCSKASTPSLAAVIASTNPRCAVTGTFLVRARCTTASINSAVVCVYNLICVAPADARRSTAAAASSGVRSSTWPGQTSGGPVSVSPDRYRRGPGTESASILARRLVRRSRLPPTWRTLVTPYDRYRATVDSPACACESMSPGMIHWPSIGTMIVPRGRSTESRGPTATMCPADSTSTASERTRPVPSKIVAPTYAVRLASRGAQALSRVWRIAAMAACRSPFMAMLECLTPDEQHREYQRRAADRNPENQPMKEGTEPDRAQLRPRKTRADQEQGQDECRPARPCSGLEPRDFAG